jgi:hypothetical protein
MATVSTPAPRARAERSVRRLIIAGGFAIAVAAAPVVTAFAVPSIVSPSVAACPNGEIEDNFTNVCTPELVPNSPEFHATSPGGLPAIAGIPCTGANTGQCIGLGEEQQAQGPQPVPRSVISSSP